MYLLSAPDHIILNRDIDVGSLPNVNWDAWNRSIYIYIYEEKEKNEWIYEKWWVEGNVTKEFAWNAINAENKLCEGKSKYVDGVCFGGGKGWWCFFFFFFEFEKGWWGWDVIFFKAKQ